MLRRFQPRAAVKSTSSRWPSQAGRPLERETDDERQQSFIGSPKAASKSVEQGQTHGPGPKAGIGVGARWSIRAKLQLSVARATWPCSILQSTACCEVAISCVARKR